ncbi:hypothetical protein P4O66_007231, partial [Electrophorus voltai]
MDQREKKWRKPETLGERAVDIRTCLLDRGVYKRAHAPVGRRHAAVDGVSPPAGLSGTGALGVRQTRPSPGGGSRICWITFLSPLLLLYSFPPISSPLPSTPPLFLFSPRTRLDSEDRAKPLQHLSDSVGPKPWVDRTIREALNSRTAAYNAGIISANMDEYKSAAYGVRRAVREAKRRYGKKLETQFQQSGSRSLWQGLRTITDYRSPPSGLMSADESLANELNTFFARFEATSSSANANGASANGAANGTCAGPTIEQRPLVITESDVRRVFKRVNTRKAMGPDGICGRVLKACADQLAPPDSWEVSSCPGMKYGQYVDWEKTDHDSATRYQKILSSDHTELKELARSGFWAMPETIGTSSSASDNIPGQQTGTPTVTWQGSCLGSTGPPTPFQSSWNMGRFHVSYAIRVLDVYLIEGYKVLYQVALALLSLYEDSVSSRVACVDDFWQDMKRFVESILHHSSGDALFQRAFGIQLPTCQELAFLYTANKQALMQKGILIK